MKRRIFSSIILTACIAIIVFGVPLAVAVQRLYRQQEIVRLQRLASEAVARVPASFASSGDPVEFPRSSSGSVGLYARDGALFTGRGPSEPDASVRKALAGDEAMDESSRGYVVALPVTSEELVIGAVRASASATIVSDRTHTTWLWMGGLAVVAVGLGSAVAFLQSRRVARPVEALAVSSRRLGEGDFSVRSPLVGVPEVDVVAGSLNTTAQRLGELVDRERSFSANAAHQLKTPLTALRLELENALTLPNVDDRQVYDSALAQIDRLESTIADLLSLSREEAMRGEFDIRMLIEEIRAEWHGPLAAEGRVLHVRSNPEPLVVRASPAAVRQILNVLLSNGVEHGAGTVSITTRGGEGAAVMEVSDEGAGIGARPEGVFERRGPDARGHGIGLALARSLAEAEGGRLLLARATPHPVFELTLRTR